MKIKDDLCNVTGVTKSIVTVSLFGVPSWVDDHELSQRLVEFGYILKTDWTRNHLQGFSINRKRNTVCKT